MGEAQPPFDRLGSYLISYGKGQTQHLSLEYFSTQPVNPGPSQVRPATTFGTLVPRSSPGAPGTAIRHEMKAVHTFHSGRIVFPIALYPRSSPEDTEIRHEMKAVQCSYFILFTAMWFQGVPRGKVSQRRSCVDFSCQRNVVPRCSS